MNTWGAAIHIGGMGMWSSLGGRSPSPSPQQDENKTRARARARCSTDDVKSTLLISNHTPKPSFDVLFPCWAGRSAFDRQGGVWVWAGRSICWVRTFDRAERGHGHWRGVFFRLSTSVRRARVGRLTERGVSRTGCSTGVKLKLEVSCWGAFVWAEGRINSSLPPRLCSRVPKSVFSPRLQ